MNEAQKRANRDRQRAYAAAATTAVDEPPAERPAPLPAFEDVVAAARARQLAVIGLHEDTVGIPIESLRFPDKSFQVVGMQSGESLKANKQNNGREHRIELLPSVNSFLVTYLDPASRKVELEFVERSSVRTWRVAPAPAV